MSAQNLLAAVDGLTRSVLIDDDTPLALVVALGRVRKAAAELAALLPERKPFNLARTIAGASVVTRDGRAVEVFRVRDGEVVAAIGKDRRPHYFDLDGTHRGGQPKNDLFMA